ncbi:MAG: hypothetical protein ACFFAD_14670 [Candidatus Hermodarchaeota archaeon]
MKEFHESKSFVSAVDSLSDYFILFLPEVITSKALQPWRKEVDSLKVLIISGPIISIGPGIDWNMMKNRMLAILEDATEAEASKKAIDIIDRAGNDLEKLHKEVMKGKNLTQGETEWRRVLNQLFMRILWKVQREEKKRMK